MPGPFVAAMFFVGGALTRVGAPPAVLWGIAVGLAWGAARVPRPWRGYRVALAMLATFACGAARGARSRVEVPAGATVDDRQLDRIVGVVEGPVERTARGSGARLATSGSDVWVWSEAKVEAGQVVAATGYLKTPRGLVDPAMPDRADLIAARGAQLEMTARTVERLGDDLGVTARAWRWAARAQARWSAEIERAVGTRATAPDLSLGESRLGRASTAEADDDAHTPPAAANPAADDDLEVAGARALRGIVLGDRTEVPRALDDRWRASGIFHVLSVSGLHLAVVAGLVFWLLKRLVAIARGCVRPARWAAPPSLLIAIAYTLVTGAQVATIRALAVVAVAMIGEMIDRPIRLRDALGVAAIAVLLWRPADAFDPSFQLSFAAAATLAIRPALEEGDARGVRGWIARGVGASAWVALVTAPLTALHFQQIAAGGVVGNLALTPPVELVALPVALGGLATGWDLPVRGAAVLVGAVDRAAGALADVVPVGRVALAGGGVALVLVALSLFLAARRYRTRADRLAWIAICAAWALGRDAPTTGSLRVTFLDAGQGDAALVELPDGHVWLVDAGGVPGAPEPAASATGAMIDRVLAAYGRDRIDLAIVSHPHPDHYLGLAAIEAPIAELWSAAEPEPPPDARGFADVAQRLAARGTTLAHPLLGVAREEAGVALEVLGPRYDASPGAAPICAADPVRSVNDNSLVVALHYRGRTILFAGDIEAEGEAALALDGPVDVVKVPHHGSPTSSSAAFVAAARPALAVVSCGRANLFGFPADVVVERWRTAGADVRRTDEDGAIRVEVTAAGSLRIDR